MSDLTLVLHERIKGVRRGVHIGSDRLREAQDNTGLSNEKLARRLYVSEKTWRRWRDLGEVPREHLPAVARELGLQFEPLDPVVIGVASESPTAVVEEAPPESARLEGLEHRQAQLLEMVDGLRASQSAVIQSQSALVHVQSALVQALGDLVNELRAERRRIGDSG